MKRNDWAVEAITRIKLAREIAARERSLERDRLANTLSRERSANVTERLGAIGIPLADLAEALENHHKEFTT